MIFPPGFDVASFFKAPERWIDSAARQTGDRDDIEAVLVALADSIQHGCGRIREGVRLHMPHSAYVAPRVKAQLAVGRQRASGVHTPPFFCAESAGVTPSCRRTERY